MDRTVGNNTLKLYYHVEKRGNFMNSAQAKFWAENGHPSMELSPDDCRLVSPYLLSTASLSKGFLSTVNNTLAGTEVSGNASEKVSNLSKIFLSGDLFF